jgi:MarR family transcriptional regulator for hemolysin
VVTATVPTTKELFGIAIGDCARIWRNKVNERLRPLGLSQATWLTLWNLSWFPEGLGQAELAERLGIEGPTLVRLLDRLEKDGLVQRIASVDDRRRKVVVLTESARPLLGQVKKIIAELRMDVMKAIPDEQLAAGLQLLKLVQERLSCAKT